MGRGANDIPVEDKDVQFNHSLARARLTAQVELGEDCQWDDAPRVAIDTSSPRWGAMSRAAQRQHVKEFMEPVEAKVSQAALGVLRWEARPILLTQKALEAFDTHTCGSPIHILTVTAFKDALPTCGVFWEMAA